MRKTYQQMAEEECGIANALYLIGGKWKMIILYYLLIKDRKFNELERLLEYATPTTLNNNLNELIEDELIYKIVLSEKPVRSVYKIAPKGKMLETVLLNLREFGLTNLNKN
ncbi:winged helix-turn-helix transcriptional regulator [Staphylococcus lutrae]|uniref:HTH hxlR-type domain-containing protein n=2 Tax=Staphylococcus lutrae TaxID=155085 RepID=A0AAC9RRY8_9STAP|nr:helix-turn-helix domain-containing protein [Staphylococcus lutrae]ARJ51283.1 hypothetical protein B5P37_08155 [Staphylococcus lutrae]